MLDVVFNEQSNTGYRFKIEHGSSKFWPTPNVYMTANLAVRTLCRPCIQKEPAFHRLSPLPPVQVHWTHH